MDSRIVITNSMASFLVLYTTGEGQTGKVADRIAAQLDERGHEVDTIHLGESTPERPFGDYDGIAVGASIHRGKHQRSIRRFVKNHREELSKVPSAFFQLSLASATAEGRSEAAGYVEAFLDDTGWDPDRIGVFGGALRYSRYGFLTRLLMKQIAKRTIDELPSPDTAGDIEFTDWHEVEAFADDFAAFVEGRLGTTSPVET